MIPLALLVALFNQQVYEMDEIVVTATRYPLALQNIAVATMVIDRSDIEAIRALDITEVLNGTAGVDIKDYGTPGAVTSVTLRGIPSNGTLVLLDGQPLNLMTTGMADLSVIDINAVERIEIVKGPVSSIYGENTLGGVMNIITHNKLATPEIRIRISPFTTTFDTLLQNKYVSLNAGLPHNRIQADISAAYLNSTGRRSNSNLAKYDLQGAFAYRTDAWIAQAQVYYDDKDYGLPGPLPRIDSLHPAPFFGDSTATSLFDHEKDASLLGSVNIKWIISKKIEWEHKLYGSRRESTFHTQYAGWTGDTVIEDHTYLTLSGGYNTMFLLRFSDFEVTIGLDARIDSLHTETWSEQSGDTTWNAQSYTIGGWCQAKKDLGDIVSIVPSARIDHNQEFGNFFSPSIGFISALPSNLVVKASAGKTYRAPGFNDLYWPLSGNRDLTPEYGWVYEVRLESAPFNRIFSAVSFFMRDIKNRIAWMPDTGGLWKPQNINELSIIGVDLECKGQISTVIDLSVQGTYQSATQRNDEIVYDFYDWIADTGLTIIQEIERDAAFIPLYTLKVSQHIHAPLSFDIDLSELYEAEIDNYYTNYDNYPVISMYEKHLNAYFLLNTAITREFGHSFTLSCGVKNIFDTDYATQFGNSVDDLNYPMPGRTYFLTMSARY
jgi:outer membrane cobalamin receptor